MAGIRKVGRPHPLSSDGRSGRGCTSPVGWLSILLKRFIFFIFFLVMYRLLGLKRFWLFCFFLNLGHRRLCLL